MIVIVTLCDSKKMHHRDVGHFGRRRDVAAAADGGGGWFWFGGYRQPQGRDIGTLSELYQKFIGSVSKFYRNYIGTTSVVVGTMLEVLGAFTKTPRPRLSLAL